MICSIRCSRNEKIIAEILLSRGIIISETASISIVEKGLAVPEKGISIFFNPDNLNELVDFLDTFSESFPRGKLNVIPARNEDSFEILKIDDICYFTAEGNRVFCHTETVKYEVKKKLYELERELAHNGFVRANKSTIVNILKVNEIAPWFGGRLLLILKNGEKEIEVSRSYISSFKQFLGL